MIKNIVLESLIGTMFTMSTLNIACFDLGVVAKTCVCKDSNRQKVTYLFPDEFHGLCVDKKDILEGELQACEFLLKCTKDISERSTLEKEIAGLRIILGLLAQDDTSTATQIPAKKGNGKRANFVICQDCFWCMSCFKEGSLQLCPTCNSQNIDSLPIFQDEHYTLEFSARRSVNMVFRTPNRQRRN